MEALIHVELTVGTPWGAQVTLRGRITSIPSRRYSNRMRVSTKLDYGSFSRSQFMF